MHQQTHRAGLQYKPVHPNPGKSSQKTGQGQVTKYSKTIFITDK